MYDQLRLQHFSIGCGMDISGMAVWAWLPQTVVSTPQAVVDRSCAVV